jgi:hypothetical protein
MSVNWINVDNLSFNSILLLERCQLSWFPGWVPESDLAISLKGNPHIEWFIRHKCPELNDWLDKAIADLGTNDHCSVESVRKAEVSVLKTINDLIVYVVDPTIYDSQPFLGWDSKELTSITDFKSKIVLDIGAGTGRLALIFSEGKGKESWISKRLSVGWFDN